MGENYDAWSKQAVQHEQRVELSWGITQPKVTQDCLTTLPFSAVCRWPPTTGNIRCGCECSCLMVIVLLRDTRTAVINDASVLSLPLKYRRNVFIYLNESHLQCNTHEGDNLIKGGKSNTPWTSAVPKWRLPPLPHFCESFEQFSFFWSLEIAKQVETVNPLKSN